MSRPLRIEFAGGLYHVTSRGDGREAIFLSEEDRRLFLGVLSQVVQDFNWALHAKRGMGSKGEWGQVLSFAKVLDSLAPCPDPYASSLPVAYIT